jgi:N-acetylmuramic acid 6-phosphate etherase
MNTEGVYQDYAELDTWPAEEIIAAVIESNARAVSAVRTALPQLAQAAERMESCLESGGRLIYLGAGSSGRLASQDAAELPPTFGFENYLVLMAGGDTAEARAVEAAEDDQEAALQVLQRVGLSSNDIVVALAASGHTPYTIAGVRFARAQGAFTVGIANNPNAPLLSAAEVGIFLDTGPEVLAGSTRLAAGTAQKIVLNALSTTVLTRLGGAYDNLMVGMRPLNDKLRRRAVTIVMTATAASEDAARRTLERSQWRMREAIVMLKTGRSLGEAEKVLAQHHGRVRQSIKALGEKP